MHYYMRKFLVIYILFQKGKTILWVWLSVNIYKYTMEVDKKVKLILNLLKKEKLICFKKVLSLFVKFLMEKIEWKLMEKS